MPPVEGKIACKMATITHGGNKILIDSNYYATKYSLSQA
jgi:hypothetical protein